MYAVIKTGGKQYKVAEGDKVRVEKLDGEPGAKISLAEVLMIGGGPQIKIGRPLVEGAKVTAEIVQQSRAKRLMHFHKQKEGYTRRHGHRQPFTELKILGITA